MSVIRLKHIDRFKDRHGKVRYYYREGKNGKRIPLPERPGTAAFMKAYNRAIGAMSVPEVPKNAPHGTFDKLVRDYYASPSFIALSEQTQRAYRHLIKGLMETEKLGPRRVAEMRREHVRKIIAARSATPGIANNTLKVLRILVRSAIEMDWLKDDPTTHIKKYAIGEHHTWTEDELKQFENTWPYGTLERTTYALLLYTGQRSGDVAAMRWTDISSSLISIKQSKTKTPLQIPLHPELQRTLDHWTPKSETILGTPRTIKYTSSYISKLMSKAIKKALLSDRCVAHGLRKAAARRLAEAGCSANEIASITGHLTLSEVQRYTKAAEQKVLAVAALDRLTRTHNA